MKRLNNKQTKIFSQFILKMEGRQHVKLEAEGFMPLVIEKIGIKIHTFWGDANLYSFCHYYELNGDLMQDPEVCFIVVSGIDKEILESAQWVVIPYSYQQADLGIYQNSVEFKGKALHRYNRQLQAEHTAFANKWMINLANQGF